mmetsp:Transcript_37613/g.94280  ORF Transcript_37613/g.94280 Transcript_37613/m.94280 type:complete len:278 (-) Transcript_37613:60-893(-)
MGAAVSSRSRRVKSDPVVVKGGSELPESEEHGRPRSSSPGDRKNAQLPEAKGPGDDGHGHSAKVHALGGAAKLEPLKFRPIPSPSASFETLSPGRRTSLAGPPEHPAPLPSPHSAASQHSSLQNLLTASQREVAVLREALAEHEQLWTALDMQVFYGLAQRKNGGATPPTPTRGTASHRKPGSAAAERPRTSEPMRRSGDGYLLLEPLVVPSCLRGRLSLDSAEKHLVPRLLEEESRRREHAKDELSRLKRKGTASAAREKLTLLPSCARSRRGCMT